VITAPEVVRLGTSTARRLLTLADRDPVSLTFGCFDRNYWHYKILKDFPSATFQQAILPLALLYRTPFPGNDLAGEPHLAHLLSGAIRYWCRLQGASGSFDEWFPGEYSQVATAFTSYAVAETIRILSSPGQFGVSRQQFSDVFPHLKRAAEWLIRHPTDWVSNHRAGTVAALETIHSLTGVPKYRDAARSELAMLLTRQDPEGWFPEYGNSDPGYLGITCAWLARYYRLSQDQRAREALERALSFLTLFLGPGGVFAGPIGGRDATYLLLGGPFLAPPECPSARPLAARCLAALCKNQLAGPDTIDDRYLAFFFAPDLIQTMILADEPGTAPEVPAHARHLPRAGLISVRNGSFHVMVGLSKGGTLYAGSVRADRPILWDAGWQAIDDEGNVWASSWPGTSQVFGLTLEPTGDSSVEIDGPFHRIDYSRPLEQFLIPFRIFTTLCSGTEAIMAPFASWLKGPRLLESPRAPMRLRRIISIGPSELRIVDRLTTDAKPITRLQWGGPFTARHAPSSKIFSPGELACVDAPSELLIRAAKILSERGEVKVSVKLTVDDSGLPHREFSMI